MPIRAQLFDGTVLEFPDGTDQSVVDRVARQETLKRQPQPEAAPAPIEPPKKEGFGAAFGKGIEGILNPSRTAISALTGSPEEAALAGLKRAEASPYAEQVSLDKVKKAYERGLLPAAGEVLRQIPLAITEQAPNIAATLGSARLGAMAGAGLGSIVPGIGTAVGTIGGGILGAVAPSLVQQFGGNIQRQAQEQLAAKQPVDISRTAAAAAALPQAGLDVAATFIPLGRTVAGSVLGPQVKQLLERGAKESAEQLARESLPKVLAKGAGISIATEAPTEAVQSMLERAQAGLPLLSEDALKEYGEAAYQAALIAPIGAAARVGERSAARQEARPPELRPGETDRQAAERIQAEILAMKQAANPPAPAPGPILNTNNLYNLIAQPNGYGLVEQYKQRLMALPEQTPEVKQAIEDASFIQRRSVIEAAERRTTKPAPEETVQPKGPDAGEAITPPSGEGAQVAGKPDTGAATEGARAAQPSGVVSSVADVGQPSTGEGSKPAAVKPQVEALQGSETRLILPDGEKRSANWEVIEADSVSAAMFEGRAQPRDRQRAASNAQVLAIANNPDFDRLSDTSQTMDYGAPTLTGEYVIVGGNGRFEGVNLSYDTEVGQAYKQNLISNAQRFGLDPAQVSGMKKPVLIRKISGESVKPDETRKLAIQSNIVPGLEMSDMERAALDSERMTNLQELDITDTGDIPLTTKNMGAIRDALKGYTKEELSGMLAADGSLSQSGLRRVKNAVLYKAYGKTDTLSRLLESPDADLKNVGTALMRASGSMSRLMDGIRSGAIPADYDIISDLTGAVETLSALRASGTKVQDFISQSDMFGDGISNEAKTILTFLDQNLRSAKSITEFLNDYANAAISAESAGDGLFGEVQLPSKQETIERAAQRPEAERAAAKAQQTIFEQPAGAPVAEGGEKPEGAERPLEGGEGAVAKKSLVEMRKRYEAARAAPAEAPVETKPEPTELDKEIEAKIEELGRVLSRIMGRFGLKDVALKLVEDMKAEGEYAQSVIRLALDAVSPVQALRHESIHALKELGFFTPQQWSVLEKQAKSKWVDQYLKNVNINKEPLGEGEKSRYDAYMDLYKGDMDAIIEEAIADAFGDFDVNNAPPGLMQAILTRLRNFFDAVKTAFGGEITAEQVFRKVEKGALKAEAAPATKEEVKPSLRAPQTEAFKKWFGNSKVVDESGEPLVVYHGTDRDINEFAIQNLGRGKFVPNELGVWFGDSAQIANNFAAGIRYRKENGVVYPAYLSVSNPKEYQSYQELLSEMKGRKSAAAARKDLIKQGYDGIVIRNADTDFGGIRDDWVAFEPTQIKSATGNIGTFDAKKPDIRYSLRDAAKIDLDRSLNDKRISPRLPTAVKAKEDAMGKVRLQPDLDTFKRDDAAFRHNIALMSKYPNFSHIKGTPAQRAEQMIEHMKGNLLWLFNSWDAKLRDRSKLWYVGGNRISHRWAEKYGIPAEQAAGIIAALSPQKDWFQNVSLAERTLDALVFNADTTWSPEMTRVFKERAWAKKFPLRKYQGTTLKDMYRPGDAKSLVDMAVWIRAWDEANNVQTARVITPEGTFTNEMAAGKTGKPVAMRAQSFAAMVKTLQVLQQSDLQVISDLIGKNHKVRSFYNNIIAPYAGDDVTIDTHAVAAALLRPLGSSDLEVYHNFGSAKPAKKDKEGNILVPASAGTKNSAVTGLYGTYAMYAEAYRRAAQEAGVLPREMQSITWEAIRGLFRPEQKQAKLKNQTNVLWNKVGKGEIDGQTARDEISKLVSGIEDPAWAKSPVGANESRTDSSYADELPGVSVPGREPAGVSGGTGERVAGAVPEGGVKFSLRSTIPTATRQRIVQTTIARDEKTFYQRIIEAISPSSFESFRVDALNRYNQLGVADQMYVKKMGGAKLMANQSAESAALMSDLGAGLTASALGVHDRMGGVPVYRNGITIISNMNGTVKGAVPIFAPLAKYNDPFAYQAYQFWAGVKRGSRFLADGREQLFEPADIQKAEDLRKQFLKDGVDFDAIQKEWIKYNDGLVNFMVATGVLSKERGEIYKKHSDYLPFYRQMDGVETVGPKIFQSIGGIKPPKKLKGGETPIDDFLENIVRNTQSAIQAGIKNIAAQRAADIGQKVGLAERLDYHSTAPNVFHVYENGKPVSYVTQDHLFVNAVKSLGLPDLPFIGLFSGPANLLRNLVTKDPGFMLANLMRDSMSAWVTSGVKMTPMVDTITNFGSALAGKSPEFQALMNSGILGGYEFSQNVEQSGREFGKALRKQAKVKQPGMKGVLEMGAKPFTSLWEALEKGSTASDAATRIEVYKKTLAETGNEAEALYRALEVMNFNRKGSSAVIRVLTAAVPFLNARMQGLDVLYRAATGKMNVADAKQVQRNFFIRGATIAALSTFYWAMTHDDDEYKKQEQETRDNYWLLPSLGVKIPIPFEIGVLFKVIPERILGYAFGSDTGEDFLKSMARQLTSTLAFNPIPQTVLPVVESMTNFSFFTMRPIVGQGLEGLQPAYQVGPGTSRLAEAIGGATKSLPTELQISPAKLDNLINGYTGTMGMYMVNLMDAIFDMNTDSPKPSRRFEQMPLIRRFAIDPEARGSVTAYYELKNSVDAIVRTSNMLERTMNYEELPAYLQDNARMLAAKDYLLDLEKTMKEFREMKILIRSAKMSAEAKGDAIASIEKMENQLTANIQYLKSLAKGG